MELKLTYELNLPKNFVNALEVGVMDDFQFWLHVVPISFFVATLFTGIFYAFLKMYLKTKRTENKENVYLFLNHKEVA